MISFDFEQVLGEQVAWSDVRVSKKYFESTVKSLNRNIVMQNEICKLEDLIVKGDFTGRRFSCSSNENQYHLAYQFSKIVYAEFFYPSSYTNH